MESKRKRQDVLELYEKNNWFCVNMAEIFQELHTIKDSSWNRELKQCEDQFAHGKQKMAALLHEKKQELENERMEE